MLLVRILLLLGCSSGFGPLSGQTIDYRDIRYSVYLIPCGAPDSASVWMSIRNLESLDTSNINKHLNEYYTDLGNCYWLLSNGNKGVEYKKLALKADLGALYHKPKDTKALWNTSFIYFSMGNCDRGKYYMALYKKYTPKRFFNAESIEQEKNLFAECE